MRCILRCVKTRVTSTASSSNTHGTRYEPEPWNRLCEPSRPKAVQRLKTPASGVPSNPPMSWLQCAKPLRARERPPRSVSAIDSNVDVESPPQCTGIDCPPGGRRPCEQHGLALALRLDQHVVHGLVVQLRVQVVHARRVRPVEVVDLERDPLAEVGLEAVHALVDERAELALVPRGRVGVREVDEPHAGLPEIPLPHRAVGALHEVAGCRRLGEQRRALCDVGVDPHADPQVASRAGARACRSGRGRPADPTRSRTS